MRVLLTGACGQLGQALRASVPKKISGKPLELINTARCADTVNGLFELDLSNQDSCRAAIKTWKPDWVLNVGAYTAVDRAEQQPALAHAVNATAPRTLAVAMAEQSSQSRMLQISTDFVFSGLQGFPYLTDQALAPLNVYGATKADGEKAVQEVLGSAMQGRATILRTSWVYGPVGSNFLRTMLKLHRQYSDSRQPLRVVADQVGAPTSTLGLAEACWAVLEQEVSGILHWTDAGAASWYDFAVVIGEAAHSAGILDTVAQVLPITTAEYPTPARRPAYSLLECSRSRKQLHLQAVHWQNALKEVMHFVTA